MDTLPPELISCVVANVESQPALYNLAQCSRQLYLCTIPHLYRNTTVHRESYFHSQHHPEPVRELAYLLLQRPDLAGFVRSFTLRALPASSEESEGQVTYRLNPIAVNDEVFKTAFYALSLSKKEKSAWLGQLTFINLKLSNDIILALLLTTLLNVEKVDLGWLGGCDTFELLRIIMERSARREKPFDLQPAFKALTVFKDRNSCGEGRIGFLASLLKRPTLRVISIRLGSLKADKYHKDRNLRELNSSSSPVTYLNLIVIFVSRANLGHILRAPKALQTFFHTFCGFEGRTFIEIRHALRPHEHCLEKLGFEDGIDYLDPNNEGRNSGGMSVARDSFFGPMVSFIRFNALKFFRASALFLYITENGIERHCLINIFPPSLETLHVTRISSSFGRVLESVEYLLAQKCSRQIPSLKTLILEEETKGRLPKLTDTLWRDTQETIIGRLSRVAAAQGVSLEVVERQQCHRSELCEVVGHRP